jgi:hypothetical protein
VPLSELGGSIELVRMQLITMRRIFEAPASSVFLQAFELDPGLRPTHWGENTSVGEPYTPQAVLAYIALCKEKKLAGQLAVLRRRTPPLYNAQFPVSESRACSIRITSVRPLAKETTERFFGWASVLAPALDVDFGLVDVAFKDQPEETEMHPSAKAEPGPGYAEVGPYTVYPRTFFSARFVALLGGLDVLRATGGVVIELGGGVVSLDLAPKPWEKDAVTLKEHQGRAMNVLGPTGVFEPKPDEWRAGPRWEVPRAPPEG